MLNSEKNCATKKISILTLMLSEFFFSQWIKKPYPPLQVKWSVPYHIFQHWIKKNKINFPHRHQTYMDIIWVINIDWGMITVLLWKKSCIDLFIERLDIVLSDFWAGIAVALPVFTYGQNWRYYLWICDNI